MKLTIEQLKSILFGAVDMAEENGRISLFRFTKKQRAYYSEKRGGELLYKTHASAGMRLDMHTDADALSFDFWVKKASGRTFYSIDLYVDGVFRESFYVNHLAVKSKGTVSFALPTGEHRVTVYLPNMMKTDIANVTLENASILTPFEAKTKILFLGDSITQGYDAHRASLSYTNRVARALDADSLNQAVGSEVFDADILDAELPFLPDTVIAAYGTNDWAVKDTEEDFLGEAERFFIRLKKIYSSQKCIYITPVWRGFTEGVTLKTGSFETACANLKALAEKHGFVTVDGAQLILHDPAFYQDAEILHPNDLGFDLYAQNLLRMI